MNGKLIAGFILGAALLTGAAVYYLQVYAYYRPLEPASAEAMVRVTGLSGVAEPMVAEDFQGIDADSSPRRYRACFRTPMTLAMLTESYAVYDHAAPLIAPNWFDCFDAEKIGADLETGVAVAFLSEQNIHPGFDRVVAVYPDGRAYAWQQPNESAEP